MTTIQPQALVAGRYLLIGRLRSTESGEVWEARDVQTPGRSVELEFLASPPAGVNATRRFEEIMNSLRWPFFSHPHVVRVLGHGRWSGKAFVVTERIVGETLAERLQRREPMEPGDSSRLAGEVADALEAAHLAGIGHGYLSPDVVIIGPRGQALVSGFGLAPGNWRQPPRTQASPTATGSGETPQDGSSHPVLRPRVMKADLEGIEGIRKQLEAASRRRRTRRAPAASTASHAIERDATASKTGPTLPGPSRTSRRPVSPHGTLVGKRGAQPEAARSEPPHVVSPPTTIEERAREALRTHRAPRRSSKTRRRIRLLRTLGGVVVVGIFVSVVAINMGRGNESAPPARPSPSSATAPVQPSSTPQTTASPGVPFIPVPDVTGLTALQAYSSLIGSDLRLARLIPVVEGIPGRVVRSNPPIGVPVPPGSLVTLYVGTTPDRLSPSPSG
jgi:hypothetical protein